MSRVSLLLLLSSLLVWSGALAYRNVFSQSRGSWRSTLLNADTESGVVDAVNGDDKILDIINAPIDDVKLDVISAVKSLADAIKQPDGTSYIMCSSCKTAYVMSESEVDKKGTIHYVTHLFTFRLNCLLIGVRVRCGVCEKEWYQTSERLLKTDMNNILSNMTETKVVELKAAINAQQWPKNPKVDKIGVFIGNLPYTYTEKELGEIFAEYGVTGMLLITELIPNLLTNVLIFLQVSHW